MMTISKPRAPPVQLGGRNTNTTKRTQTKGDEMETEKKRRYQHRFADEGEIWISVTDAMATYYTGANNSEFYKRLSSIDHRWPPGATAKSQRRLYREREIASMFEIRDDYPQRDRPFECKLLRELPEPEAPRANGKSEIIGDMIEQLRIADDRTIVELLKSIETNTRETLAELRKLNGEMCDG